MNFLLRLSQRSLEFALFLHKSPKVLGQWFSVYLYAAKLLQRVDG